MTKGLAGVAVALLILAVVVGLQPADYRIVRTVTSPLPPELLFSFLNDSQQWQKVTQRIKLDPKSRISFEGPVSGVGAVIRWSGNRQLGEVRMTIVESDLSERIRFRVKFQKPVEHLSESVFELKSDASGTLVTWSLAGRRNFIGKAICLFVDLDTLFGDEFERRFGILNTTLAKRHE